MKGLILLITLLSVNTAMARGKVICQHEENSKIKATVSFDHDEFGKKISVNIDNGAFIYEEARGHSGGRFYFADENGNFILYSTDYCVDYKYKTRRIGSIFNRSDEVYGFDCSYGDSARNITINNFVQSTSNTDRIESIKVSDFTVQDDRVRYVNYLNCKKVK